MHPARALVWRRDAAHPSHSAWLCLGLIRMEPLLISAKKSPLALDTAYDRDSERWAKTMLASSDDAVTRKRPRPIFRTIKKSIAMPPMVKQNPSSTPSIKIAHTRRKATSAGTRIETSRFIISSHGMIARILLGVEPSQGTRCDKGGHAGQRRLGVKELRAYRRYITRSWNLDQRGGCSAGARESDA